MKNIKSILFIAMITATLLSACGSDPTAVPAAAPPVVNTATPVVLPTATTTDATQSTGVYTPISLADCEALKADVMRTFNLRATLIDTPFVEPFTGESGMACTIEVDGSGEDFANVPDVMNSLRLLLEQSGWTEDISYQADGPTGSATAFRLGNGLILATVGWEPAAEANCPSDQPISACDLTAEQMMYIVSLKAAEK